MPSDFVPYRATADNAALGLSAGDVVIHVPGTRTEGALTICCRATHMLAAALDRAIASGVLVPAAPGETSEQRRMLNVIS